MIKQIIILGAGKSATCLINHLLEVCMQNDWQLTLADNNFQLAQSKTGASKYAKAVAVDIRNADQRNNLIQKGDLIISLLPPTLQLTVTLDCIRYKKHLLTASYLDEQVKELSSDMKDTGALFLFEMGLDPGIDHMSATKWIEQIRQMGGMVTSFRSHCGGLVSPDSDDNPWHYKISWNPRNVVMAGEGGALYKENDHIKEVNYLNLFRDCQHVSIPQAGKFAFYPNRDSMRYMNLYQLPYVHTFVRTTLRHPAYCAAWHAVINAGLTNTDLSAERTTFAKWSDKIRPFINPQNREQLTYLGLFDQRQIPEHLHTSADILQYLFETKLPLQKHDKDMIVMMHEIEYILNSKKKLVTSSLIVHGENYLETAMAKTVGMPLGIAATLVLQNKIRLTGLQLPITPEIYTPVLHELERHNIRFRDEVKEIITP